MKLKFRKKILTRRTDFEYNVTYARKLCTLIVKKKKPRYIEDL